MGPSAQTVEQTEEGWGGGEKEAGPGTARGFLDTHTGLTVYFVSLKTNVSKDFLHDLVF